MFKVGDFVSLNEDPRATFIVTRIYNKNYFALGTFDVLDGWIEEEYKVKQKYFSLVDPNMNIVPGMSYSQMLIGFIEDGYFSKLEDGSLRLNYTEDTKEGYSPSLGLDLNLYPINAIE